MQPPDSKLPDVGTTIFAVISQRAAELGAVNLGQGFPDYEIDPRLGELVHEAMRAGFNQYAPMAGSLALRAQIALKLKRSYHIDVDPDREITVTVGATESLFSAVQALVMPGDEVIVFDPAYDAYDPAVRLAGGRCLHLPLLPPAFGHDWERVAAAITTRTRLIILNSPHNPGCSCLSPADLPQLAALVRDRPIRIVSDEVYEHVVFDGGTHHSVLALPELRERSVAVFSFGKTLHATGLRVGYAVAPPALTAELRKVHQFNTFSVAHALQQAIAHYLQEQPDCGVRLAGFFQQRRDRLRSALAGSGLELPPAAGAYFQLADYSRWSRQDDVAMARELLEEAGVATIPLSPFYREPPPLRLLRLCIAKRETTLDAGAQRLLEYAARRGWA
ncbi:MAG TPA: methionine aminotransferase [Steroidobacteraceae bacterium]|nr:methionine aminotransferase [Steroidobacteraceae bacterium]